MAIEVTEDAVEVLQRSLQMGGVDTATGGARIRRAHGLGGGMEVQVELADQPLEGETVVEAGGIRLFVDRDLTEAMPDAVVAVDPQHDNIVVRPAEA